MTPIVFFKKSPFASDTQINGDPIQLLAKNGDLQQAVWQVLDAMDAEFTHDDELLQAQGILVVYYLVFRAALKMRHLDKVTRRKLLNFRERLAENREAAAQNILKRRLSYSNSTGSATMRALSRWSRHLQLDCLRPKSAPTLGSHQA
jgi:hypothetical protein